MIVRTATHADIPAIARVHVDTWRTTYRGIISDTYLENLSYEQKEHTWHQILNNALGQTSFTYVAESESGQIVGFANGGAERTGDPIYKGEINSIYILENHQHQGIGRCLVQALVQKLGQMDIYSMMVWVLASNPACQFYAALGGQSVYEKEIAIAGATLTEVAYGWIDTSSLGPKEEKEEFEVES